MDIDLPGLAEPARAAARAALREVLGGRAPEAVTPVTGGASGAGIFRVDAGGRRYLLRIEAPPTALLRRNPHRFVCQSLAAAEGLAPAERFLDADAGVAVTDFIDRRPIGGFPGGPSALAEALGELFRRLQTGPAFPPLVDYRVLVREMLEHLRGSGAAAPGLLDPHLRALEALCDGLPWDPDALVASHNDPNPNNILFDGERLWLIDWEAGYRNHPFVDLGIVSDSFATTPELLARLLTAALARAPSPADLAAFQGVRRLTRLYYACFLIHAGAGAERPVTDLRPAAPSSILADLRSGAMRRGGAEVQLAFGKLYLEGFLTGEVPPGLRETGAAAF